MKTHSTKSHYSISKARRIMNAVLVVAAGTWGGMAIAAPIYANSAVTQDVTSFGSGLLTGAPDNGGAFLSNTFDPPTLLGSITAGFAGGLTNGAGIDLVIHDCCSGSLPSTNEFADVFVSTNGVAFTFLGAYGGPSQTNSFDFNGIFAGTGELRADHQYGKGCNSPDIDAFEGLYAAAVPEPESYAMLLTGPGLLGFAARRRKQQASYLFSLTTTLIIRSE